ncbi:transposase [Biformimicrobium ophioploci]|uniref:IS1182-like element ISMac1 family transposase n=1 Tax=Biformimicrobium ophioploci TaxID=3036711 RepID=A0ABQ6M325_9GAMM|nr:transposase [Microbulbifer sp. NKW57]GMG88751.1 IS1182-like element ISMac1 family transposase [Microbulbifer sp. NKW57]
MGNFRKYSYNQDTMVVVNFEDQIQPGTFEFTLHRLVEDKIDLSAFYEKYNNDEGGSAAYDPAILLKIILFAYSKGITSSRQIHWHCKHNITFMALACGFAPCFTRIAAFVSSFPDAIESVFEQVLMVCDQQGLLGKELFAIDGCKMSSNASKEHSGTLKELGSKRDKIRKQIRRAMAEHKALDGRKPQEKARKQRLNQAMDTLQKHFDKIDAFLKTAEPRMGQGKQRKEVKSNITDNESAKMTTSKGTIQGYNGIAAVDKKHQIIVEAQAFGEGQEQHTLKPVLDGINQRCRRAGVGEDVIAEQVIVTADTGFSNAANDRYLKENNINAYIPDNQFRSRDKRFTGQKAKYGKRHQDTVVGVKSVIPASEFAFDKRSKSCVCPAGNAMMLVREENNGAGKRRLMFEGRLTDCRHCPLKAQCMRNPAAADTRDGHGRQVSLTWTNGRTPSDWMKHRVDSVEGKTIYGHRMSVVEPVFGNIGTNKRLNRFSLRGREKVQGQWRLFCLIHNIEKLQRYGAMG